MILASETSPTAADEPTRLLMEQTSNFKALIDPMSSHTLQTFNSNSNYSSPHFNAAEPSKIVNLTLSHPSGNQTKRDTKDNLKAAIEDYLAGDEDDDEEAKGPAEDNKFSQDNQSISDYIKSQIPPILKSDKEKKSVITRNMVSHKETFANV